MSIKQVIWSEIDAYLRENKQTINSEIKEIKNLNLHNANSENLLFSYLKKKVLTYLEKSMFISENKTFIERSIITIYLLRSDNPPLQTEIRRKAGFTANYQVKEIREYLCIPLPLQEYEKLVDDPVNQIRQCRNCRKLLEYNKFTIRKEGRLRWECNQCRKTENIINVWRKKIKVAEFITMKVKEHISITEFLDMVIHRINLDTQIQCFNCNADLNHLPALQFHHTEKHLKIKGAEWNKLRFKPLDNIIKKLDPQKCILLCANCHAMRTATFFNLYKNAIFSEVIEEYSWRIRGKINRWIRKKKIIEDLFDGKCAKCQKTGIDEVPALQFHHLDPSKKRKNFSTDLRDLTDIKKIKRILIEENCTCLCSNCHSIESAIIFMKNKKKILQKEL